MNSTRSLLRELFDRSVGLVVVIVFLWLFLVVALLISLTSEGPILQTDEYAVNNGRVARFLHFETSGSGSIRQILRKYSIDDFPAFWNVLRGDGTLAEMLRWSRSRSRLK
jgi:lipopolysaccharide/colanic/teichoic acid biosynthesis glycosyltransferase